MFAVLERGGSVSVPPPCLLQTHALSLPRSLSLSPTHLDPVAGCQMCLASLKFGGHC